METKIEKLKESRIRTVTTLTADEKKAAEEQALRNLAAHVRIKGFRDGQAPPEMVRAQIKPEQLTEETVRVVLPGIVAEALKQSGAKPIIRPSANVVSLDPLTISLTFVERPEAKLRRPDSIKVEKKPLEGASEKDVEDFIQKLLRQDGTETPVDRASAKGDIVKLSLAAKDSAGKQIDELTVPHYSVAIGNEELLPELEPHITGMKKGEKKTVQIDFPKDHDLPTVKGKKLTIDITAKEVAESQLPELTPDYLKSRLGAERSPDAFRVDVKQMLSGQKKNAEMKRREEELYAKVKAATEIAIAPELVDAETQDMLRDLQQRLKSQETTVEQWLEQTGKKWEQVVDEMKTIARDRILLRFGMQLLAEHTKVEPEAKELEAALAGEKAHAKDHGHPLSEDDLKPGGNFYEQASWELKMQKLVQNMIEDAPAVMKKAA